MFNIPVDQPVKILITGVCGHSYGAQVAKSLSLLPCQYQLYGADANPQTISEDITLKDLSLLPKADSAEYIQSLLSLYKQHNINFLIEGSEAEQKVLNKNRSLLKDQGIFWITNDESTIDLCRDKRHLSAFLQKNNFFSPFHYSPEDYKAQRIKFPIILKPNSQSGGSNHAYIAQDYQDIQAILQLSTLRIEDFCFQEYIGTIDQEYTLGILHNNEGKFLGAATLRRDLKPALSLKISVNNKTNQRDLGQKLAVSSGFSQGHLIHHEFIEHYCREVAEKLNSRGPLNFQGRIHHNHFYIFEINPRFSGTSFMRALSGFNEADLWLKNLNKTTDILPFYVPEERYYKRIVKEMKGI